MASGLRVGKGAELGNQGLGSDHLGSACASNRCMSQSDE